jgi:hypothetical protein
MMYSYVECQRCGSFQVDRSTIDDVPLPLTDERKIALASYSVRKLQTGKPPILLKQFFDDLSKRELPTPGELADNLLIHLAQRSDYRPGAQVNVDNRDLAIASAIGAVNAEDVLWALRELVEEQHFLKGTWRTGLENGHITGSGWRRIDELRQAHALSRFAFFARKLENAGLDQVYEKCLYPAVRLTGYELRTVTQKAGHIDAIIEDEIRRCKFLLADLSDDNAGAYWEAGLAEGLGKPVIYICREGVEKTHFDTEHRHTVRWDLKRLDDTAKQLKAVIRNTLLGDARQED